MGPLAETRERFLLAITTHVPAERIAEIHFFSPIKQGGTESGVAVVAAWPEEVTSDEPAMHDESVISNDQSSDAKGPLVRHVVYTARYRFTLKGPDRGKWETNVVAEADAPLVTVDAVVRGVQRRAGEVDDPTRMDGEDVRAFVESRVRSANSIIKEQERLAV